MWKAFDEMEELGWLGRHRPRMVTVQAEGCAPIVKAFHEGADEAGTWENAATIAGGLRVPAAIGSRMMLAALRESGGTAVAVSDNEIREAQVALAANEGIFASLEGAATIAALLALVEQGWLSADERILVFNTGSGLKHRFMLT
jgi:threonine synthase